MISKKINKDVFWESSLFLLLTSVIGARLYHVLDYWDYYSNNYAQIFNLRQGGLGIFGAIFLGFSFIFIYSKIKNINFFILSDIYLFWAFFVQVFGRFGNWFNKELYGLPTNNSFFKIYIPLRYRYPKFKSYDYFHPLFFYEIFFDLLAFFIFLFLYKKLKIPIGFGIYSSLYLIFYGIIRLILEPFRIKFDTFEFNEINLTVYISYSFILVGLLLLINRYLKINLNKNEFR